jgi:hypothetical protein
MRVGVVFSNVLLNQGPDFDLGRRGAAAASQSRRLGALAQRLARPQGRTRAGTRRDERLFGGRRHDHLFGARGDDPLFGRGGNDVLLQGAHGNDRIYGGRGDGNIDGHPGPTPPRAVLATTRSSTCSAAPPSTPGAETTLWSPATGTAGDTVVCRGAGRKRILADPGDRIVGTVSGSADAVARAPAPPARG